MVTSSELGELVREKRNTLKSDRLDMSFGEIMNMYDDGELIISPEYQRLFRWSLERQSRFIESILMGVPIPPIFVAENSNGHWELVDGLQRISSILAFFGLLTINAEKNNFSLLAGDIIAELDGFSVDSLPTLLKTGIKRSVCRVEILRWDSDHDLRFELFNRLNTGSEPLTEQEIRNCIYRGEDSKLNDFLKELSSSKLKSLVGVSKKKIQELYLEELILRFIALSQSDDFNVGVGIQKYMSDFMKKVTSKEIVFDFRGEKDRVSQVIDLLNDSILNDSKMFKPSNGGGFAEHYFDAITQGINSRLSYFSQHPDKIDIAIKKLKADPDYLRIGAETYSTTRLKSRLTKALEIFNNV